MPSYNNVSNLKLFRSLHLLSVETTLSDPAALSLTMYSYCHAVKKRLLSDLFNRQPIITSLHRSKLSWLRESD